MSKETVLRCEVSDTEILNFNIFVPYKVQMRMLLNKKGLRFFGDGNIMAVITDEDPIPLGKVEWDYDISTGVTRYKQTIIDGGEDSETL